jgi:hypothetical protein
MSELEVRAAAGSVVEALELRPHRIGITLPAEATRGGPDWGHRSGQVYSHYERQFQDLASHERSVHLRVHVHRFRCGNTICSWRTFPVAGSIFASSKLSLRIWFRAVHHMTQAK